MVRAAGVIIVALLLGACGTPPVPTATRATVPLPTLTASPIPAEPTPRPTPTPEPTPGLDDVPIYTAGQQVVTNAPGLRMRSRPGIEQRVVAVLGLDTDLLVELGPVLVDGLGWYLVRDADPADPSFGEVWVAAGFDPDPFLVPTTTTVHVNPWVAGFAHDADGEFGPVRITDARYRVVWAASPLTPNGCRFAVDFLPSRGDGVRAVRSTLGSIPAPGELFSQYFADHPELRGDIFISVESDCSWAISFAHLPRPRD